MFMGDMNSEKKVDFGSSLEMLKVQYLIDEATYTVIGLESWETARICVCQRIS